MSRMRVKSKLRFTRVLSSLSRKAGWVLSIPESITAHTISLESTVNNVRAASAFTAGTDRVIAGSARRFNDTVHTSGCFGFGPRRSNSFSTAAATCRPVTLASSR